MKEKVRIGFVTTTDPRDKRSWSGIHAAMLEKLEQHYSEVKVLGPFDGGSASYWGKVKNKLLRKLFKRGFDYSHSTALSRNYAQQLQKKIEQEQPEILIVPSGSTLIGDLETSIPIILLSDTTLSRMLDYYPAYTLLSNSSKKQSLQTETNAIRKSRFCVFPSEWAAESAIRDHGANREQVKVIPFGANFRSFPSKEKAIAPKDNSTMRLLFLGVDWHRKGGPIVLECFRSLQKQGVNVKLTIVGCTPPIPEEPSIRVIPFINKNDAQGEDQLKQLLLDHHFLFLPSQAECYGIVFCEASSCGTPSITRDTGGIEGAVKNGINGFRLAENATAEDYEKLILELLIDQHRYRQLQISSRELFENSHNWDHWAAEMKLLIAASLEKHIS